MRYSLRGLWALGLIGSSCAGTGCAAADQLAAAPGALRSAAVQLGVAPRLVLVWLDVSASMPPAPIERDLARLAVELGPGDRVIVAAMSDRTHEFSPVLDTLLPGGHLARLGAAMGLSTARSRLAAQHDLTGRARMLEGAWTAARKPGLSHASWLLDAVCHSAELASTHPATRVIALLLTDGVVEQPEPLVNLAHRVPSTSEARRVAARLGARGGCSLAPKNLTVRLSGVTHRHATAALRAWWRALLEALEAPMAADDVASHRVRPLLSSRGAACHC